MSEKLTPEQEERRARWDYRAVATTLGDTTDLGRILLAVLGFSRRPPWYGPSAVIDLRGHVLTSYQASILATPKVVDLGPVDTLVDEFRRLLDLINATDEEAQALVGELRKWAGKDYRVLAEPNEFAQ